MDEMPLLTYIHLNSRAFDLADPQVKNVCCPYFRKDTLIAAAEAKKPVICPEASYVDLYDRMDTVPLDISCAPFFIGFSTAATTSQIKTAGQSLPFLLRRERTFEMGRDLADVRCFTSVIQDGPWKLDDPNRKRSPDIRRSIARPH